MTIMMLCRSRRSAAFSLCCGFPGKSMRRGIPIDPLFFPALSLFTVAHAQRSASSPKNATRATRHRILPDLSMIAGR
jgi:hypothetical protein